MDLEKSINNARINIVLIIHGYGKNCERGTWITEVLETLDYNIGPAIFLWRVPNIFLGNTDSGIGVGPQVQLKVGNGSIVRVGPALSCWNNMDLGSTKTQELSLPSGAGQSHPEQAVCPLSPIPSFGVPASSILHPGHYLKWSLHCGKTLMTEQCQETWGRILAPPLVSYGAINTLLNLSEPVSPCVKWLWSAYVLRVLWGLSRSIIWKSYWKIVGVWLSAKLKERLCDPFKLERRHLIVVQCKSPCRGQIVWKVIIIAEKMKLLW